MINITMCMALLFTPGLGRTTAIRGCALTPWAVEAAQFHGVDATLLMAIAYQETRFKPWLRGSSGEAGAWQTMPRWVGLTPKELQGQPGAQAAADMLKRWGGSPYKFNCGYRRLPRCAAYDIAVRKTAARWRGWPLTQITPTL